MEPSLQFHWPDSFFIAFPLVVVFVVLPAVLIYIVFTRTNCRMWQKILLVPLCVVSPTVASALWPLFLKTSGLIGATGEDGSVPYAVVATGLFGDYSEYVWGGITTIVVVLLYRWSGQLHAKKQGATLERVDGH